MNEILINKYRQQLMGLAAIGVILVHSNGVVAWPSIISFAFGCGGIGVYMFVFLSAIGLYLSLKQEKKSKKKEFYMHRFTRVLLPYLCISVTWYGVKYLIIEQNFVGFLWETSLLSYWFEHKGAWFVAMLIPVYLIFPWFYDWVETEDRNKKIFSSLIILVITTFVVAFGFPVLFHHISQVLCSYIIYLAGYYEAEKVYNKEFNGMRLSILSAVLFVIRTITPLRHIAFISDITWAMFGITILITAAWLLDKMDCKPINIILSFFGKYSLEMYLWNIFLIQIIQYFKITESLGVLGKMSGYAAYGIVVCCGVALSVVYGKFAGKLSKKICVA
ncbi:MAG: acyltransferase [Acetatifactor sp.]|nr:acyltransferase [Acetatifactor sp.]